MSVWNSVLKLVCVFCTVMCVHVDYGFLHPRIFVVLYVMCVAGRAYFLYLCSECIIPFDSCCLRATTCTSCSTIVMRHCWFLTMGFVNERLVYSTYSVHGRRYQRGGWTCFSRHTLFALYSFGMVCGPRILLLIAFQWLPSIMGPKSASSC